MELKENMLFRTKAGTIGEIDSFTEDKTEFYFDSKAIFSDGECIGSKWGYTKDIVKTATDVVDLMEENDLVKIEYYSPRYEKRVTRIFKVDFVYKKCVRFLNSRCGLNIFNGEWSDEDIKLKPIIKQILTHEQFESISYKIGE